MKVPVRTRCCEYLLHTYMNVVVYMYVVYMYTCVHMYPVAVTDLF